MEDLTNNTSSTNLSLIDESGKTLISSQELNYFPDDIVTAITQPSELRRVADLTSNIFKGYASTPNKTVELLFKPEIKKGLDSGVFSMMKTKSGETLADAIDNGTKKIVGKARVIEGGRLKQLATGSYQLLSIIVAQSHLEDINRALHGLKSSIDDIKTIMENDKLAKIHGRISYLEGLVGKLRVGDFDEVVSQQIKNKIEDTISDANEWQSSILLDIETLISNLEKQQDEDSFGTGNTYKKIRERIESLRPIILRRNMILCLASLISYLGACIDPTAKEFSSLKIKSDEWNSLLKKLCDVTLHCIKTLLKDSRVNTNELLELRRDKIKEITLSSINIANHDQTSYDMNHIKLQNSIKKMISGSGKFRLAVSFDSNGIVNKAGIID
ncbi:hypothetical protein [Dickeya zeae]|uniref:hypothetical protein n=1 Tax=Dickeya zeae TaxID=204042 RepID=UPI001C62575C|nr:hypothetical protein [Dickeya zeae]